MKAKVGMMHLQKMVGMALTNQIDFKIMLAPDLIVFITRQSKDATI
jgi:hypothetical protein